MKYLLLIPLTFFLPALLPASARAQELPDNPQPVKSQVSGWDRVRDLARGDEIYIQTAGGMHQACRFGGATEDSLFCDPLFDGATEGGYRLDRTEVERIRLEQSRWNLKEFVGAGAAVGFAVPLQSPNSFPASWSIASFGRNGSLAPLPGLCRTRPS